MTLRCFSGDASGDGGGDDGGDDGLAQLGDGEGDMSDSNPTTTTPSDDDGSMTTTPMTSGESGDEFGSLPDESGDMMGEEEEDQVSRRGKQPLKRSPSLEFLAAKLICGGGAGSYKFSYNSFCCFVLEIISYPDLLHPPTDGARR